MNNMVHYLGLDVHKETIAVSIAPGDSREVRRYSIINGSLDAVDKPLKKLAQPGVELRLANQYQDPLHLAGSADVSPASDRNCQRDAGAPRGIPASNTLAMLGCSIMATPCQKGQA